MNPHIKALIDFMEKKHENPAIRKHALKLAEIVLNSNYINFDYEVYSKIVLQNTEHYSNSFYNTCNNLNSILKYRKKSIFFNTTHDITVLTFEKENNFEFYSVGFDLKDNIEYISFELRHILVSPYPLELGFPDNLYIHQKEYTEITGVNKEYNISTTNNPTDEQKQYIISTISWNLWKLNFVLDLHNIEQGVIKKVDKNEFSLIMPKNYDNSIDLKFNQQQ